MKLIYLTKQRKNQTWNRMIWLNKEKIKHEIEWFDLIKKKIKPEIDWFD